MQALPQRAEVERQRQATAAVEHNQSCRCGNTKQTQDDHLLAKRQRIGRLGHPKAGYRPLIPPELGPRS